MKKRSVGLVLLAPIEKDGEWKPAVVLQRRGLVNHEDGEVKPEKYPNCFQVTCHGKLKEGEGELSGLFREMREELGREFAGAYSVHCAEPVLLSRVTKEDKEITTFGSSVSASFIKKHVRLGPDSGGLLYITADQVEDIVETTPEMEKYGPEMTATIAMFADEIETTKKAFEVLGGPL